MTRINNIFQPTVLLAVALMAIIVMMILPMPAWVLVSDVSPCWTDLSI